MKKYFLLVIMLVFFIYGCSNKTLTSEDVFKKVMTDAGYVLHDAREQFNAETLKSATVARNKDNSIEFFILASEEDAMAMFSQNVDRLESMKGNNVVTTSVKAANYGSYTLRTNGKYYTVSRIGYTMIYSNVPAEQKEVVSDLIKSLGY